MTGVARILVYDSCLLTNPMMDSYSLQVNLSPVVQLLSWRKDIPVVRAHLDGRSEYSIVDRLLLTEVTAQMLNIHRGQHSDTIKTYVHVHPAM